MFRVNEKILPSSAAGPLVRALLLCTFFVPYTDTFEARVSMDVPDLKVGHILESAILRYTHVYMCGIHTTLFSTQFSLSLSHSFDHRNPLSLKGDFPQLLLILGAQMS